MNRKAQSTVQRPAALSGVGLHSGIETRVEILPAAVESGIVFHRRDLGASDDPQALIRANALSVCDARLGTTLGNPSGARVSTIEHLMAALVIAGVDNAVIAVDGAEVPIMDGSAWPFLEAIEDAGLRPLADPRRELIVPEAVELADGDRRIRVEPSASRSLTVSIAFDAGAIGEQSITLDLDDEPRMREEVGRARTFCRLEDIEQMRRDGLARGGSLENAIVVDGERILNAESLRHDREFAAHKALDLIGDLALVGARVRGLISANKPGHDLNTRFAQLLYGLLEKST